MPKQVTLQQCDFCQKTASRYSTIERHEKLCIQNPSGINCFLCANQEYGPWYYDRWDGGQDVKDEYYCNVHEVLCTKDMALGCSQFERKKQEPFLPIMPKAPESTESA